MNRRRFFALLAALPFVKWLTAKQSPGFSFQWGDSEIWYGSPATGGTLISSNRNLFVLDDPLHNGYVIDIYHRIDGRTEYHWACVPACKYSGTAFSFPAKFEMNGHLYGSNKLT